MQGLPKYVEEINELIEEVKEEMKNGTKTD